MYISLIQATLDTAAAPILEQLRERYPIGNHSSFPTKRVVTSKQAPDQHWELNDIRLRVWAAHIVRIFAHFYPSTNICLLLRLVTRQSRFRRLSQISPFQL